MATKDNASEASVSAAAREPAVAARLGRVRVAVRVRPLLPRELQDGAATCLDVDESSGCITVLAGPAHTSHRRFVFDHVLGSACEEGQLYESCVTSSLDACFDGYNATVLAAGQTGSGKTHTLGQVVPQVVRNLFHGIQQREACGTYCQVTVQYVELYNEELRDLLAAPRTQQPSPFTTTSLSGVGPSTPTSAAAGGGVSIREAPGGEIFLEGAREVVVSGEAQLLALVEAGNAARATAETALNEASSRSHAILLLALEQQLPPHAQTGEVDILYSKLHLVDLAGSERTKRSGVAGVRLREAVNINQGLLALGNVISALGDGGGSGTSKRAGGTPQHVPYRDSKLTRLLQDSLGGNSMTTMVACISAADDSLDETLNTLKYASRARHIQNRPTVNLLRDGAAEAALCTDEQRALALLKQVLGQAVSGCTGAGKGKDGPGLTLSALLEAPLKGQQASLQALRRLMAAVTESAAEALGMTDLDAELADLAAADAAAAELLETPTLTVPQQQQPPSRAAAASSSGAAGTKRRSSTSGSASLSSHPVVGFIGGGLSVPPPRPVPPDLLQQQQQKALVEQLQQRVGHLEAQVEAVTAELTATRTKLAMANEDLDRDEIIFARQVQEVEALRDRLETALQQLGTASVVQQAAQQQQERQPQQQQVADATAGSSGVSGSVSGQQVQGFGNVEEAPLAAAGPAHRYISSNVSTCDDVGDLPPSDEVLFYRSDDESLSLRSDADAVAHHHLAHHHHQRARPPETAKPAAGLGPADPAPSTSAAPTAQPAGVTQQHEQSLPAASARLAVDESLAAASAKQAADRAQADLEQRLATHQQQHDAERQGLEGQIQELEQGIREREDLIAELHLAEAQARSSVVMYQAQLHALQHELALKEGELAALHRELACLGDDRARSEGEKEALRLQCQEKIAEANARLVDLRRRLKEQEAARSAADHSTLAARLRAELTRMTALQTALRNELNGKVQAHERHAQQQARELAALRRAAEAARAHATRLEEESRKQKGVIKQQELEAKLQRQRIQELSGRHHLFTPPFRAGGSAASPVSNHSRAGGKTSYSLSMQLRGSPSPPRHRSTSSYSSPAPKGGASASPSILKSKAQAPRTAPSAAAPAAQAPKEQLASARRALPLMQPLHRQWLERVVEAAAGQRQAEEELAAARGQQAALGSHCERVEGERRRLEERMRQRRAQVQAGLEQLEGKRAALLEQLQQEDERGRQHGGAAGTENGIGQSAGSGGGGGGSSGLGFLVQQAEEVEAEAQRQEVCLRLGEVQAQVEALRGACSVGGAWAQLQLHERQLLDRLDALVEQLHERETHAAGRVREAEERLRRAASASQQLRRRVPALPPADMRSALLHMVDVLTVRQHGVAAAEDAAHHLRATEGSSLSSSARPTGEALPSASADAFGSGPAAAQWLEAELAPVGGGIGEGGAQVGPAAGEIGVGPAFAAAATPPAAQTVGASPAPAFRMRDNAAATSPARLRLGPERGRAPGDAASAAGQQQHRQQGHYLASPLRLHSHHIARVSLDSQDHPADSVNVARSPWEPQSRAIAGAGHSHSAELPLDWLALSLSSPRVTTGSPTVHDSTSSHNLLWGLPLTGLQVRTKAGMPERARRALGRTDVSLDAGLGGGAAHAQGASPRRAFR